MTDLDYLLPNLIQGLSLALFQLLCLKWDILLNKLLYTNQLLHLL